MNLRTEFRYSETIEVGILSIVSHTCISPLLLSSVPPYFYRIEQDKYVLLSVWHLQINPPPEGQLRGHELLPIYGPDCDHSNLTPKGKEGGLSVAGFQSLFAVSLAFPNRRRNTEGEVIYTLSEIKSIEGFWQSVFT
jgi:hypothetical protein